MQEFVDVADAIRDQLQVPKLSERVARRIEGLILGGQLRPGARLVEEALARQLGISRASLREAIIGLEQAGLIVREGRSTRMIRRLVDRDVVELYELWTMLEGEAAAMACRTAAAVDHAAIAQLMDAMEQVDDTPSYHRLNLEFHLALVAPCPNRRLAEMYRACIKQVRWAWALAVGQAGDPSISLGEHRAIAAAYFARDAERVRALVRAHLAAGAHRTIHAQVAG